VDTTKIIIKYLKLLQHVSDLKGSTIRELYTVLGLNHSSGSILFIDMDVVGVMAAYLPVMRVSTAESREARVPV
jgi:hypothetical protein